MDNWELVVQNILTKYRDFTKISNNEFAELLETFDIISHTDTLDGNRRYDPRRNYQVLCHGAGKKGRENLDSILNATGLKIANRGDGNNWVASGVCSTNVICNDAKTNQVDYEKALHYKYVGDENGETFTIISTIPIGIEEYYLGRVIRGENKEKSCVLDDLGMQNLPKEFILGVVKGNYHNEDVEFKINPNYYNTSGKNYLNALNEVEKIFKNYQKQNNVDYYESLRKRENNNLSRRKWGLEEFEFSAYQQEIIDSPWFRFYKNAKLAEAQPPNSTAEPDREM